MDNTFLRNKTIVFCLPGREFSGKFLVCWSELLLKCKEAGINIFINNKYSSNVYHVRSMCLGADVLKGKYQIPFQNTINYDYIMWIDSDIHFSYQQIFKMLKTMEQDKSLHILSGLYAMDGGTHFACVKKMDKRHFIKTGSFEFIPTNENLSPLLFKADYNGMGFMLVRKGVYEKLEYPWFGPRYFEFQNENNQDIYDFCSEDVAFCLNAKQKGFDLWIDPSIRIGHEKIKIW
jgi:GT2 family glycosyltransferase